MALKICPNCWNKVSDKAKVCPGCGHQLIEEEINKAIPDVCEDCGAELSPDAEACPKCGCPVSPKETVVEQNPQKVEIASVNLPVAKESAKKYMIVAIILVAFVILAIIIGSAVKNNNDEKASTIYSANLQVAKSTMLEGASEAESAGNLIKAVWYNTIYEKRDATTDKYTRSEYYNITKNYFNSDFNDSLNALFSDSDFISQISTIQSNQETVASLMRDLQNPPEEYEEAYEAIKELYDAYLELTNLVINPTGSLQTFSNNFSDADSEVLKCYNEMEIYTQ